MTIDHDAVYEEQKAKEEAEKNRDPYDNFGTFNDGDRDKDTSHDVLS